MDIYNYKQKIKEKWVQISDMTNSKIWVKFNTKEYIEISFTDKIKNFLLRKNYRINKGGYIIRFVNKFNEEFLIDKTTDINRAVDIAHKFMKVDISKIKNLDDFSR